MILEKSVQFVKGDWAYAHGKNKNIEEDEVVTILDEGTISPSKFLDKNGNPKKDHVFGVKTKSGDKIMRFTQQSRDNLIDAYGNDTKQWIGRIARVWFLDTSTGVSMCLAAPGYEKTRDEEGKVIFLRSLPTIKSYPENDQIS